MTNVFYQRPDGEEITVDLRDPRLAAFLAWLWPGAGHFYQRRFVKGFLFMICIMGTFIYGMLLGQGRVVYASFKYSDFRWQYFCQAGIGTPALFAMIQKFKTDGGGDPFFVLAERYPPVRPGERNDEAVQREFQIVDPDDDYSGPTLKDGFMAPPFVVPNPNQNDVLGMWHASMKHRFDVGTIFTIIAGLLNILAIYDAFAGPLMVVDRKHLRESIKQEMKREASVPPAKEKAQQPAASEEKVNPDQIKNDKKSGKRRRSKR